LAASSGSDSGSRSWSDDRAEQVGLVAEMVIDGLLRDAGFLGDRVHVRRTVTVAQE
jgi:hypothetical protein